jgi:hypothetical protein
LAATVPIAGHVSPLALSVLTTLALVAVGAWETVLMEKRPEGRAASPS